LADNQLTEITDNQLESLLSLISLNVRGNKIQILPEQIALLPNLERLDVTNNDLAEYRIYFLKIFNSRLLFFLHLSFSLPSKIGLNKKIKNISMIGNPLGKIRKDVIRVRQKNMYKIIFHDLRFS
jgi:Leucine-rich repeat (LRR) protein